ncbi:MAG: LicD family protein [Prevotella sp.]|nr:LicD family protein [Prevotella sp.]
MAKGTFDGYTPGELERLHTVLYEILAEIVRVCDKLGIPYFVIGGTAIGAFFREGIIPWDDDIDIGMTRSNYNRFLREAPAELRKEFFLQWEGSEKHTPFYFAKVRRRGTLFVEGMFRHLDICHGIYIDVFPFDKVPDNRVLQSIHRTACNFLNCCFMGKEIWMWRHCGKCEIDNPTNRGFLPCLLNRIVCLLFTKRAIYRMLSTLQSMFNACRTTYYNLVLMPKDHISVDSINRPQTVRFGPLNVSAPSNLETYLRHHYPNLRRDIPEEEQENHRPAALAFDVDEPEK